MDSSPSGNPEAKILLVEDNPGDVRLVEEAFRDGNINNHLYTVTDGQEALDFIHREGEHEDVPRPDIILLDLNLPQVDSEDILYKMKNHPELEHTHIIILSGMSEDFIESRDLDHDGVIEKPFKFDKFIEFVSKFNNF